MSKENLIKEMQEGNKVVLEGNFSDCEMTWNYEYWTFENDKYVCSYDGEFSHYFDLDDLEYSFNPNEANEIEIQ